MGCVKLTCKYKYSNAFKSFWAKSQASLGTNATRNKHLRLCEPGLDATFWHEIIDIFNLKYVNNIIETLTLAKVCSGSNKVSLCLRRLLTCSRTNAKCSPALIHNLFCNEATTSFTLVVESYLNDLVCPFSRNTLSTLGNKAMFGSPPLNADTYIIIIHHSINYIKLFINGLKYYSNTYKQYLISVLYISSLQSVSNTIILYYIVNRFIQRDYAESKL